MQQLLRQKLSPPLCRIRPPRGLKRQPKTRLVTRYYHLRSLTPGGRPQLPYLATSSSVARLISTRTKENLKYQLKLGVYWSVNIYIVVFTIAILSFGSRHEWLERQYPSPKDWNYYVRVRWHEARQQQLTDGYGTGVVDWAKVGSTYRIVMSYIESFKKFKKTSKDIRPLEEQELDIDFPEAAYYRVDSDSALGQSAKSYDINAKSYPWKACYFDTLIGAAKSAENLDDMVADKTRKIAFKRSEVIGPSNPYPTPVPSGGHAAPLEENCVPIIEPPEFYYTKILTTKGFSNKQRMDAGLAYAFWLDFKGDHTTALSMYKWSLGLACSAIENPSSIINSKTGVLQSNAVSVTPNVLTATTALASHLARTNNVPAALNIYLSVLRARRSAPEVPPAGDFLPQDPDLSLNSFDSIFRWLSSIPTGEPDFPAPPPSGDEPFKRSRTQRCDEAGLMVNVGEILFATAGAQRDGLSWTRDAVALAESGADDQRLNAAAKAKCKQCLEAGLLNWEKMVKRIVEEEDDAGVAPAILQKKTKGWFGVGGKKLNGPENDWRKEKMMVQRKLEEFYDTQLEARLQASVAGQSKLFITGV